LTHAGLGTGVPLLDWLKQYTFNYESRFNEVEFAQKVYPKVVRDTLRQGSTTVSYFATIHLEATKVLYDVCVAAGQRALIGKVCMDRNAPDYYIEPCAAASLEATKSFIEYCAEKNSPLVKPTITPRFAITCTPELLEGLGDLAERYDCHVQSHLDENVNEIDFVKKLFPGKSYTQVYKDAGLLTNKTVMAHCVQITDDELAMLRESGSGIAHCPTSNLSMFSGLAHVRHALDSGVHVGLGTDVAGGYAHSILTTMRDSLSVSSAVASCARNEEEKLAGLKFEEAFFMATLGGAQAIGLSDRIGNFSPGKAFDALVVDVTSPNSNVITFGTETASELFQQFIYLGDDRNIEHIYVQGRRVHGSAHV